MNDDKITQERLQEILHYDPDTGVFTRRESCQFWRAGDVVGNKTWNNYLTVGLDGTTFRLHRLAFLYMLGRFPKGDVDHIDRDRQNNVWTNLREVSRSLNMHNNTRKGFSWCKKKKCWRAYLTLNYRQKHLGYFDTPEAARQAHLDAKHELNLLPEVPF